MRYFLVSYGANTGYGINVGSSIYIDDSFPSREKLIEFATSNYMAPQSKIHVLSIFEFKSEEEYNTFMGGK
jgi:hypothetical protein